MQPSLQIQEATVADIDGCRIGVSNLWEREFNVDEKPVQRMSATLSIMDTVTSEERRVQVFAGFELELRTERYRVVKIQPGSGGPGVLVLEKVAQ